MLTKTTAPKHLQYVLLISLAVLLLGMVNHFIDEQVEKYQRQIERETEHQLRHYYDRINANLQSHIQLVRALPSLFVVNPNLPDEQFAKAVQHLMDRDPEIRNVAAAPDMIIRYMYPLAGNEQAIGLDYRKNADQFEAADRARRTREVVLAGPVELVQGGVGMITRIPVFIDAEQGEEFWGLISAVIDMELFLKKSGLYDKSTLPIKLAIAGKDGLGRLGGVFYGDPDVLPLAKLTQTLKLPEGEWVLAAEPLVGWNAMPNDIWLTRLVYYGGACIIWLILFVMLRSLFAVALANNKFRHVIDDSPVPYVLLNNDHAVQYVNQAFIESYGYKQKDFSNSKNWWQITDDPLKNEQAFQQLSRQNSTSSEQAHLEVSIQCKNGEKKVALLSVLTLVETLDDSTLVLLYDITERKRAEDQLRFSSRVFNQAQEGIIITTIQGVITDVNPAFCDITGYSREEVIGQQPDILKSGKHSPEFYKKMWNSVLTHGYWQGEVWNRRKNGELYAELLTVSALTDDDGETRHLVGLFSDITQSKQQQETLELMAHYDVLTRLPNRVLFADRYTQAVAHTHKTNTLLAVCFFDLDGFKPVNDSYGHEVGDQLLVEVASRLQANVRDEDTISRFGGDEFALLLRDINSEAECEQLLKRIHYSLSLPYEINENVISISASSGVTFYPTDESDLDTLLRHADQSMYQAKMRGRNTYHLFNTALSQQSQKRQQWLDDIRRGLEQEEFRLFYQPKVNMRTGRVIGFEALIRWAHPEQGLLSPIKFLPTVEGTQLEQEIGRWVMAEALKQLATLHHNGYEVEVSINIASSHLLSTNFVNEMAELLELYPAVNSHYLQLEILESSALGDITAVSKVIKNVRDSLGGNVALDDFGTGYSSLTHLRHLAVETIKIDQSFVRDMLDDPQDYTIVDGVIGLAKSYGRKVIAEGVETHEHGILLLLIGCERAQGYGIARPMPSMNVLDWLDDYQPNQEWMDIANTPRDPKQHALQLFDLVSQRWLMQFKECVTATPDEVHHWPILAPGKCHCGRWLKRVVNQDLFEASWLEEFQQLHRRLHHEAAQIHELYLTLKVDEARERFEQIKNLEQELDDLICSEY